MKLLKKVICYFLIFGISFGFLGCKEKNTQEIDSEYGTEEDLKILIEEAHKLDIKIYTDMVVNHTS